MARNKTTKATYTGLRCDGGISVYLNEFLLERAEPISYRQFAREVDVKSFQVGPLSRCDHCTFLRSTLPSGKRAWVLQWSGFEHLAVNSEDFACDACFDPDDESQVAFEKSLSPSGDPVVWWDDKEAIEALIALEPEQKRALAAMSGLQGYMNANFEEAFSVKTSFDPVSSQWNWQALAWVVPKAKIEASGVWPLAKNANHAQRMATKAGVRYYQDNPTNAPCTLEPPDPLPPYVPASKKLTLFTREDGIEIAGGVWQHGGGSTKVPELSFIARFGPKVAPKLRKKNPGDDSIGRLALHPSPEEPGVFWVGQVAVAPKLQRMGIATDLYREAVKWLRQRGGKLKQGWITSQAAAKMWEKWRAQGLAEGDYLKMDKWAYSQQPSDNPIDPQAGNIEEFERYVNRFAAGSDAWWQEKAARLGSYRAMFRVQQLTDFFPGLLLQHEMRPADRKILEKAAREMSSRDTRFRRKIVQPYDQAYADTLAERVDQAYAKKLAELREYLEAAKRVVVSQTRSEPQIVVAGGFRLVNAGGFKQEVMSVVAGVVAKADEKLRQAGLECVIYGDINVVNEIIRGKANLAHYQVRTDEVFLRGNIKGLQQSALMTVLHELGHRFAFKFLGERRQKAAEWLYKTIADEEADVMHDLIFRQDLWPKPDEVIDDRWLVTRVSFSPRGLPKVHLRDMTGDKEVAHMMMSEYIRHKNVSPNVFVTGYARSDPHENFAEMFAYNCMDMLTEEHQALLSKSIDMGLGI